MVAQHEDDAHFFQTVDVEVAHRFFTDARTYDEAKKTFEIDAAKFQAMATAAVAHSEREAPGHRCVISMKGVSEAAFTKAEHFVPEGLGFNWTTPGPGVGTCDDINREFGNHEGEWLRQGKMGIFRPFFVGEGKDAPPAYYAPNMKEKLVWFTRDEKTGRRVLCISHNVPESAIRLPDRAGPGQLVIRVPHNAARVVPVSLALHKMALLMFWLCEGSLAFDAAFADLRAFLLEPDEATYRSFTEELLDGASPGVALSYLVSWRAVDGKHHEIDAVYCVVRAHHMKYALVLAGTYPVAQPHGPSWTPWADPKGKVSDHTPIVFGHEGIERVTPRSDGNVIDPCRASAPARTPTG